MDLGADIADRRIFMFSLEESGLMMIFLFHLPEQDFAHFLLRCNWHITLLQCTVQLFDVCIYHEMIITIPQ